jgi:hypothetical protein
MPTLNNDILAAAIDGFEAQKKRLDEQIAELRRMMNPSGSSAPTASAPAGKRRTMSAAARKRIAEAQRKRWAAVKKDGAQTKTGAAKSAASKTKRRLSPEGRRRIIEATKKRWAAVRAAAAAKAGK